MLVAPRRLLTAVAASGLFHVVLVGMTREVKRPPYPPRPIASSPPRSSTGRAVAVSRIAPPAVAVTPRPAGAARIPGDADHFLLVASAPTRAPHPDPTARRPAASSGDGPGAPRFVDLDRRDEANQRAQLYNAATGYQLQRLRTDERRLSREEARTTPSPGLAPELASRSGSGRARRRPGEPRIGVLAPSRAAVAPPSVGGGGGTIPAAAAVRQGGTRIGKDGDEAEGFVRPLLAAGPAATDGATRSEQVADRLDAAQVSSALVPARFDLGRPAPPGRGRIGHSPGVAPAWLSRADGVEAVPPGDPSVASGEALALATYRRHYDGYVANVRRRVFDLLAFPRHLAIRLEQGDVIARYTIRRDGTVADLRLTKRAELVDFDRAALDAIRAAAPFGPLPAELGGEIEVTQLIHFANPSVY